MDNKDAPLRIALVGAGPMAREHAQVFAAVPGIAIAGVCSRTRITADALAARFPCCAAFTPVDEMDAVFRAAESRVLLQEALEAYVAWIAEVGCRGGPPASPGWRWRFPAPVKAAVKRLLRPWRGTEERPLIDAGRELAASGVKVNLAELGEVERIVAQFHAAGAA